MDFGALPPEINSGRMYAGPGAGPLLAAAVAWDELAAGLGSAASGYGSVVSELASQVWRGPTSISMSAAAAPYVAWLSATAIQAEQAAAQAKAAVAAYETAFAMTVPPPVIAANRAELLVLIATNFLGQNTPAIAANEAHYAEMWAQDATAMYGYAGSSAAAAKVNPFTQPPSTTKPAGVAGQAAAVAKATSTSASGEPTAQATASVPQTLQSMTATTSSSSSTAPVLAGQGSKYQDAFLRTISTPYFFGGLGEKLSGLAKGMTPVAQAASAAATSLGSPGFSSFGGFAGLGGGARVSASVGQAGSIGKLSVPPAWAAAAPGTSPAGAATPISSLAARPDTTPAGLLRGLPLSGTGRRTEGFIHRYGFRYPVVPRPPAAG
ncbi:hypothetical protein A5707_13700 [Mycobacterium kyorinense]|uniref:PPE family protein n=1 Tax=Mycobacterium kyorinense TaxID=487514 RepID=A0A1A2ZPL7_9MYCO|nr:PPE family protein [Mycobacterium kyorinense]OBI51638.1 hypothetical protein A5707_13700 [Mycobacterium kyorinense]